MNKINITPAFKGQITHNEILLNEASLELIIDWNPSSNNGLFFESESTDFKFFSGIRDNKIFLQRNNMICEVEIPSWVNGKTIYLVLIWSINSISITAMRSDANDIPQTFRQEIKTSPTECPTELRTWAREQQLVKKITFNNEEELLNSCITALQNIRPKLLETNSYYSVWNTNMKPYKPKNETQIQPFLHSLVSDQLFLNGITIHPEVQTGVGNVDFLMSGFIKDIGIKSICVEVKNAHCDIKHGLTSQLVSYMNSKNSKYGIFCILYFKGQWFNEPLAYNDINEMELDLNRFRLGPGNFLKQENIKVVTIDLSKPKTASQKN
jgi:hypothetical protein